MERTEPSLVPEWLKTSGNATGNGTTAHPHSSSSAHHSDDHAVSRFGRSKSRNPYEHELGWSPGSDRNSSSSYFRRSCNSNGSAHLCSYGSFGRNSRSSRDWDRDAYERHDGEKSLAGSYKQRDFLETPFSGNLERDGLKRSQSMVSAKRGEAWPKRSTADAYTATRMKNSDGNGILDMGNSVGSLHKTAFEREFPSLGSDEKPSAAEIGRIPSPVLSTAIHGMPLNSSSTIGTDKWTSALAEAPAMVGGSNVGLSSGQQVSPSSSVTSPSASTGLNMAETVAQGSPRALTAPKTSTGIQRFEELAIRQSRQLIPVTPMTPKPLVLNSADKGKGKSGQQQHPTLLPTPFRGLPAKNDTGKSNNAGKLLVLKPVRERIGWSSASKDNLVPTVGSRETTSSLTVATSVTGSVTKGSAPNVVSPSAERKHAFPMQEKRLTSQSQSRSDFFNLMRKKSLPNSSAVPETGPAVESSMADGPGESASTADEPGESEVSHAPVTPEGRDVPLVDVLNVWQSSENMIDFERNNAEAFHNDGNLQNGRNHAISLPLFSEEEEAAFLHKLGWQENADEGEGALTEEEISAFFRDLSKYVDSKPSVKILQGVEPKLPMLLSSQVRAVTSGLSSSDSDAEA